MQVSGVPGGVDAQRERGPEAKGVHLATCRGTGADGGHCEADGCLADMPCFFRAQGLIVSEVGTASEAC